MYSSRLRHGAGRNRLAVALEHRRAAGLPILDLTLSNPTCAGFTYPRELLKPLSDDRGFHYDPHPFGLRPARQAVSADFSRRDALIPPERIVLTTSTSEAYSLLFKLLCDPGDCVLAPQPSYPLIEHLADLDAVAIEPYRLEFHGTWSIEMDDLRDRLPHGHGGSRVRAIVLISPNNPTGAVVKPEEAREIAAMAREHDVALIVDEVFADYPLDGRSAASVSTYAGGTTLTFTLGGLSKTVGLPQLKLGWIGVGGAPMVVTEAMERLETICDTYLSVSTPVQAAAPELLREGAAVRAQIQTRIRGNLERLKMAAAANPACSVLPPDAGWYTVVQVPNVQSEEALVVNLVNGCGVLVHPGYFFDFPREAFLVVSLLPEPQTFTLAVDSLFAQIGGS
jgi:alanine-synthesizing transaminase